METWVTRSFGGDRLVLVPSALPSNTTGLAGLHHVGIDPVSKQ